MPLLDVGADLAPLRDFLRREPVLNSVALGLVGRASRDPEARPALFALTVEEEGRIVAAALRLDFPKLVLSAQGEDAHHRELAAATWGLMPDLPCAMGTEAAAVTFAAEWERLSGVRGRPGMDERLHVLDALQPGPPVPGRMRLATVADLDLVVDWLDAFGVEALGEAASAKPRPELVERLIATGVHHLWEDGGPVALAGARETGEGVARIGPVYTQPGSRRRGYGRALTAAATQRMLDLGCSRCCLFTDLANPTSNHIYAEIGYRPVAEYREFWFTLPA